MCGLILIKYNNKNIKTKYFKIKLYLSLSLTINKYGFSRIYE